MPQIPSPRGVKDFFALKFEVKRIIINGNKIIPRGSVYKNYTDMKTKYVQKVIEDVHTTKYQKMSSEELRKNAACVFNKTCRGRIVTNLHTGIPVRLASGKKTAHGGGIYSKKVAVIPMIPSLIEHACYSNWGPRKAKDPKNLIGYYNFKAYIYIDGKKECVRLAVRAMSDGAFYYNVEVNKKQ